jgi:transcription antitermination factor NusG
VYSSQTNFDSETQVLTVDPTPEDRSWYAVHTKSRHEKRVAAQLAEQSVCTFLPLLVQLNRWSDRKRKVEVPLFSCYAFVRIAQTPEDRLHILRTPGVLGFVGYDRRGTAIPQEQIESIQTALRENIPCSPHAYIETGKRVRIRGGSLDGVEGILERHGADQSLIVSVELLRRSVSIRVAGYDVEVA